MRFSLALRVFPQSRAESLEIREETLRVHLTAPAANGKANEALVRILAKTLNVPKSAITIARGARSREKLIFIEADSLPEPYLSIAGQEK
ncbi:MAG: DUF167 domain-containing protein [Spirochaetota bacterium]|jgi:uncharacterized protein (TIGR00251 family)|nr:DUF167 domain-containing protein [Spirochaetota bacterium]